MLSWSAILDAARNDLKIGADNRRIKQQRAAYRHAGASARAAGQTRPTAFLGKHVRYAEKASDILKAALRDANDTWNNHSLLLTTRAIYAAPGALTRALNEAIKQEKADQIDTLWLTGTDKDFLVTYPGIDGALKAAMAFLPRVTDLGQHRDTVAYLNRQFVFTAEDAFRARVIAEQWFGTLPAQLKRIINETPMTGATHVSACA